MARFCRVVLILSLFFAQAFSQHDSLQRSTIEVSGDAVVNVAADVAMITFGVVTSSRDISTARDSNMTILGKALAVCKECGIEEQDVHANSLSIQPLWSQVGGKRDFLGYEARTRIVVMLKHLQQFETLLTKELQSGVTNVDGVEYQSTEFKKHRRSARELAVKAAQDKARQLAAAAGVTVGDPISISETSLSTTRRTPWGYGGGTMVNNVQYVQPEPSEYVEGLPVGEISLRASVNVTFELKK